MFKVRAVHTFVAEHGDELEFQAGEEIEVLEKDEAFGDGWWRGRNLKGEEGLFPATYITEETPAAEPAPRLPSAQPSPKAIPDDANAPNIPTQTPLGTSHGVLPSEAPAASSNGVVDTVVATAGAAAAGVGNMMGKTIGDIQDAIESIAKPESDDEEELGIRQDARARLAEQAKLANEQREKQRTSGGVTGLVYSDESEDEEDHHHTNGFADAPQPQNGTQSVALAPTLPIQSNGAPTANRSVSTPPAETLEPALPLPATPPVGSFGRMSMSAPSAWTVDEVVNWAAAKGFDESICAKFQEHEISGDLLLELDANLLKELDIPQFGKRLRIAQAIAELRRPSSVASSQLSPGVNGSMRGFSSAPNAFAPSTGTPPISSSPTPPENGGYSAWSHGRKTSGTPSVAPPMAAIKEGPPAEQPATSTTPSITATSLSMPASPVTPSTSTTKRESTGSIGHKKGKTSLDQKDRLSFFGRNRKPAPSSMSPGTNSTRVATPSRQMQTVNVEQPSTTGSNARALQQIGKPDFSGYMKKKGERYGTWKTRYFVLKGPHLYYMKSEEEDRVKGHIELRGQRVIVDENTNPGSYGFRLVGADKPHSFSSSEQTIIREWMKALMKATIARDYSVPVTSSCNIPTIPLAEAQALSPRPPSPATRDATQRATRRENVNQLTAHDASVLMSLDTTRRASQNLSLPSRPSRDGRRPSSAPPPQQPIAAPPVPDDTQRELIEWVNNTLPPPYPKASSFPQSFTSGEVIFLLVRSLSGIEPNPPVPPDAFAPINGQINLEGLFAMMDILIDSGIDTVGVSINDVRSGEAQAIARLLESVRGWTNGVAR
ncbi:hypothetical protein BCR39DRAFT_475488 [Naematelia encephala]|uniref:Phospholipid binding protein n=1 Tax=Naematelia encephala TaxID=71784 RepID=A0A1Y2BLH0_9TREE|nr:hypothetical protein BCR39DRAFT_475488 [Naematelia encephala]